jgi:hypothetical protein
LLHLHRVHQLHPWLAQERLGRYLNISRNGSQSLFLQLSI